MRQAYKFRLFPNRNQARELGVLLETHRRLYNACLTQRKESWEQHKKSIGYCQQSAWFKSQRAANEWFAKTNFSSAQGTMRRLDKAFANFFRRVKAGQKPGYPRFKAADRYDSIEFPAYGDGIRLTDNRLRVQHVGTVRCKAHRPVEGTVKTATLKREAGKWFVVLSCDLGDIKVAPNSLPPVGIDVGLENFFSTSDGDHEPNPRFLKKEIPELRRLSRSVSRKRKGGRNRRKAVRRLQRLHARIVCCRHDHRHKTSLKLVRRYGTIAVESLNIRGMLGNHRLARAISDAGWDGFLETLGHKAERAGGQRVEVDCRGTSQECSGCHAEVRKSLSERVHRCHSCGLVLQRDVNAARNILARALQARTGPVGAHCQRAVSQEAVCFS
jgi:putative transposase